MDTDRTYDLKSIHEEMSDLLSSFDIYRAKDSLTSLLLFYCKHVQEVPASFSDIIEDLDALLLLLNIINRHKIVSMQ